jgi:group I intron endonuclease
MASVYGIQNRINGKWYVGSTLNSTTRLIQHFSLLHRKRHHNQHLQSAFNLYGKTAFQSSVLEECDPKTRIDLEKTWAEKLGAFTHGYNIRVPDMVTMAEETKTKISHSMLGVNTWTKGVKRPREVIKRIHRTRRLNCKPISVESRQRYRLSKLGQRNPNLKFSDQMVEEAKQLRKNGLSFSAIGQRLGISTMHTWNICNGKRRSQHV